MVDPKLVRDWIKKADEDLLFGKSSLEKGLEFYPQICFHFHQAVEKYLKAYILAKELDFQKIHDLVKLLQICAQLDGDFNSLNDLVSELNPYYLETRYPEFATSVDEFQTEKALKDVEQIANFIKSKLK